MDSCVTISGFFGHHNDFWKSQKFSKFLTKNSVKIQVTLAISTDQTMNFFMVSQFSTPNQHVVGCGKLPNHKKMA